MFVSAVSRDFMLLTCGFARVRRGAAFTRRARRPGVRQSRSRIHRLRERRCDLCETGATVAVHQIAALRQLVQPGPGQPAWAALMAKMRQKTLIVCTPATSTSTPTSSRRRHKSVESQVWVRRIDGKRLLVRGLNVGSWGSTADAWPKVTETVHLLGQRRRRDLRAVRASPVTREFWLRPATYRSVISIAMKAMDKRPFPIGSAGPANTRVSRESRTSADVSRHSHRAALPTAPPPHETSEHLQHDYSLYCADPDGSLALLTDLGFRPDAFARPSL